MSFTEGFCAGMAIISILGLTISIVRLMSAKKEFIAAMNRLDDKINKIQGE